MAFELTQIDANRWQVEKQGSMRTSGIIYAGSAMIDTIRADQSLAQVANVACLPGIVGSSLAMPDIHWGYGFPIGGVAAFDMDEGVVSPGGVGYDINCGVRLMSTAIPRAEITGKIEALVAGLFASIPSGVGSHRKDLHLKNREHRRVLEQGAAWAVGQGYGSNRDLQHIEDGGMISGADPDAISDRAYERGSRQLGTLGSGNHFVEIDWVDEIYDEKAAARLGLVRDSIAIAVHTGSRGFGYQVCDDAIKEMLRASKKYGIELPDRQLCCAPLTSPEGKRYLSAMACAANYAFANRQIISHWVRETFQAVLGRSPRDLQMELVYDVCHNIAKIEEHMVDGQPRSLCVHRKGATRAFAPGHSALPEDYRDIGQPVLIPGDMGRCSYVLTGTQLAMDETFGSTCHGAGRMMSRHQAIRSAKGRSISRELADRGIVVQAAGKSTMAEEMPEAYKDVSMVVDVVHAAGVGKKVARLRPLGVIKG